MLYAIQGVTRSIKARRKPIKFLKHVYDLMRIKLEADEDYTGPLCKNPLHSHWKTTFLHSHEYSLNELNDFLHKPKREYVMDLTGIVWPTPVTVTYFINCGSLLIKELIMPEKIGDMRIGIDTYLRLRKA